SKKSWKTLFHERLLIWVSLSGVLFLYLEWKYLLFRHIASAGGIAYFDTQNLGTAILTMAKFIVWHYLKPLILGISFCADFTRPAFADVSMQDVVGWSSALFLSALGGISFYTAFNHRSRIGFCGVLFVLLLVPVLHIIAPLEVIGA